MAGEGPDSRADRTTERGVPPFLSMVIRREQSALAFADTAAESRRNEEADPTLTPAGFRSRIAFFSPKVENRVLHALAFILTLEHWTVRDGRPAGPVVPLPPGRFKGVRVAGRIRS